MCVLSNINIKQTNSKHIEVAINEYASCISPSITPSTTHGSYHTTPKCNNSVGGVNRL